MKCTIFTPKAWNWALLYWHTAFFSPTDYSHPDGLDSKESADNEGDPGSILGKLLLEKGMATHCSILAWRIPGTEESGGLQSMGSQIV